jgi:protein-S-isoprenylcysteine O-methyltransferase Ste14
MKKAGGAGFFAVGVVLVILGIILRWDLIDWLIDTTGLLLIVIGAIVGIIGLIQMFSGGSQRSSEY